MTLRIRSVAVKQVPEIVNRKSTRAFLREMEQCLRADRPRIVLDCSLLLHVNRAAIHLLLCCLEEAMKRNGDVRLAALRPEESQSLQASGADRLFEIFESVDHAVASYSRSAAHSPAQPRSRALQESERRMAETAA